MGKIGFHFLFPGEAANECRTVTPLGRTDLPSRTFVFMEAYCAEPRGDCRRVMLHVIDAETHDHVATINYAFEPPKPLFDDEGQMFLDPLNPQTAMSPAFLELAADMIANDRTYHDRLVRHYMMWKGASSTIRHIPTRRGSEPSQTTPPRRSRCAARVRRSAPTIRARVEAVASTTSTRCVAGGERAQ